VQILISGGAGSKPKPTGAKGIFGIGERCRCKSKYVGVQRATPLIPLGFEALTWHKGGKVVAV